MTGFGSCPTYYRAPRRVRTTTKQVEEFRPGNYFAREDRDRADAGMLGGVRL